MRRPSRSGLPVPLVARLLLAAACCLPAAAIGAPQGVDPTVFRDGFEPPAGMPRLELLRVGSQGPLGYGSDVMLSWVAEAAATCTASTDRPAHVSGWSGSLPSESLGQRVRLLAGGSFTLTLSCSNDVGVVQRSVTVEIASSPFDAPGVSLTLFGSATRRQADSVNGSWGTLDAQQCAATESGPAPLGFAGSKAFSGTFSLALSRPGIYALTLACSNASGTSAQTTHLRVDPLEGCSDPMILPGGWPVTTRPWSSLFSSPDGNPFAYYPDSVAFPTPVGARRGGITAIQFHATADSYRPGLVLSWAAPVSANPAEGYPYPQRASGMFFSISRCPGDVRPPDDSPGADPSLSSNCRGFGAGGTLFYSALLTGSSICRVQYGPMYYINVMAADPGDGLADGETTCEETAPQYCDVDATHRGQ